MKTWVHTHKKVSITLALFFAMVVIATGWGIFLAAFRKPFTGRKGYNTDRCPWALQKKGLCRWGRWNRDFHWILAPIQTSVILTISGDGWAVECRGCKMETVMKAEAGAWKWKKSLSRWDNGLNRAPRF